MQRNEHNLCGRTVPPSSETVGNGLRAVPGALRIQAVQMNGTTPRHVIPTEMKWSGGIFPSGKFYLTQVIFATWEDSSTPLCCGRNDMSGRWFRFIHTGCFRNVSGTAHRPFPTVSLIGMCFNRRISKTDTSVPNNCQLSNVNCQLKIVHCPLSIVNLFPTVLLRPPPDLPLLPGP